MGPHHEGSDPTIHRAMSERSYHGATSRSLKLLNFNKILNVAVFDTFGRRQGKPRPIYLSGDESLSVVLCRCYLPLNTGQCNHKIMQILLPLDFESLIWFVTNEQCSVILRESKSSYCLIEWTNFHCRMDCQPRVSVVIRINLLDLPWSPDGGFFGIHFLAF